MGRVIGIGFDSQYKGIGEGVEEYNAGIADIGSEIDDRSRIAHATDHLSEFCIDEDLIENQRVTATAHTYHYRMLYSWWSYAPYARDYAETIADADCQPTRSLNSTHKLQVAKQPSTNSLENHGISPTRRFVMVFASRLIPGKVGN